MSPPLTVEAAAAVAKVQPGTIRKWLSRGHITKNRRGLIDQAELLAWWEKRNPRMVRDKQSL